MKYFFACGELSGDRIAGQIAAELLRDTSTQIKALGGPHLQSSGVGNVLNIKALQVMGWTDIIKRLPRLSKLLGQTKNEIRKFVPDIVVLVDNASFNLRLARWCKKEGHKVVYLIPPKVWASRPRRIAQLKSSCDLVLSLFPFEEEYLKSRGVHVEYFGHPIEEEFALLELDAHFRKSNHLDERPILSMLPGSRVQEIKYNLPTMIGAASQFSTSYNICISVAPSIPVSFIKSLIPKGLQDSLNIMTVESSQLLIQSHLSVITSGTATLEAAILGIPHICCYRMHPLNYLIAKQLLNSRYISLPNLVLDTRITPELIQNNCSISSLKEAILSLENPAQRSMQIKGFHKIHDMLSQPNSISSLARAISAVR